MRRITIILIFIISLYFSFTLDKVDAAQKPSTVKCAYTIKSPLQGEWDSSRILTKIYIYFNPENERITKVTHLDKDNKNEVKFSAFDSNYSGYTNDDPFYLKTYTDLFNAYVTSYKNTNVCPDVYIYRQPVGTSFDIIGVNYNIDYASLSYTTAKAEKKYTSNDGNTWKESDVSSDKQDQKKLTCSYNFGTTIGNATVSNHLNLNMDITKVTNITIYPEYKDTCGKQGYSYIWDSEKQHCYTKGTTYYDIVFSDPDSNFIKNYNGKKDNDWPDLFSFGKSSYSSNNEMSVYLTKETLKDIFSNDYCLSQEKIYSYLNPDNYNGWQIVITSDYEEAKNSQEDIYDGNSTIDNGNSNNNDNNNDSNVGKCEVLPDAIKTYIMDALKLIRWIGLVLLVILGTLDFVKAAAADDQDAMKKASQNFIKRLIAVIILFLLPILIDFILYVAGLAGLGCGDITNY